MIAIHQTVPHPASCFLLQIRDVIKVICLQGVHAMLTCMPDRVWRADEKRYCKMVFIGRDLDKDLIRNGFQECLVT